MSLLYGIVIVMFCGCVIAFFVVRDKKYKRRHEEMISQVKDDESNKEEKKISVNVTAQGEVELTESHVEAVFEDFKIDDEAEKGEEKTDSVNPFESLNLDEDDEFAEYERFLRRNLELDEQERKQKQSGGREKLDEDFVPRRVPEFDDDFIKPYPDDEDEVLKAIANFDFDSIKGKSSEEIAQILKDLPPKAQEIIMQDILARRDFDEP